MATVTYYLLNEEVFRNPHLGAFVIRKDGRKTLEGVPLAEQDRLNIASLQEAVKPQKFLVKVRPGQGRTRGVVVVIGFATYNTGRLRLNIRRTNVPLDEEVDWPLPAVGVRKDLRAWAGERGWQFVSRVNS